MKWLYLSAYIASIVLANWLTATYGLVAIGFGLMVTAGTFAAGAALVVRDGLQYRITRSAMLGAIMAGACISAVTAGPAIALASGIAFVFSELVDWGVFSRIRERSLSAAVIVSSLVSAPIDTVLFLYLSGIGVTWQAVLGQVIVKTVIALVIAVPLAMRREAVPA